MIAIVLQSQTQIINNALSKKKIIKKITVQQSSKLDNPAKEFCNMLDLLFLPKQQ